MSRAHSAQFAQLRRHRPAGIAGVHRALGLDQHGLHLPVGLGTVLASLTPGAYGVATGAVVGADGFEPPTARV